MFEGLLQPMHLIVILAIALIIFGPAKLPEIGKGLGKSIRDFKKAMSEDYDKPVTEVKKDIPAQDLIEVKKEIVQLDIVEAKREMVSQDTSHKS